MQVRLSDYIDIKQSETAKMKIAIIHYPNALMSSVYGLGELFEMANGLYGCDSPFCCCLLTIDELNDTDKYDLVILPPSIQGKFYLNPDDELLNWLHRQLMQQATLCSACSGAFILAKGGFLDRRKVTTHWALAEEFQQRFPNVVLDTQQILINEGNIITAGGVMSWLDLGLEIVAQHAGPSIMAQLGKHLVIDTGDRAQSYYQQFIPKRNHGDSLISKAQLYLDQHYGDKIIIADLSLQFHTSERSFLRRFQQACGLKPSEYLQHLRIQKACDELERTKKSFDVISQEVGYDNSSACRKVFVRLIGLTPKEFRQRFVKTVIAS